jgi:nucleotide-binding universal stress UspA family protein
MKLQKILVPTDFSRDTDAALEHASTLAAHAGAVLYIAHVDDLHAVDVPLVIAGPYGLATEAWNRSAIRERLERILPPNADVPCKHQYLEGLPVEEIVKFAEREKVDLIVMASHGRSGLRRLLMGSVAEGVMRKAKCPVLIVKQPFVHRKPGADVARTIHSLRREK